MKPPKSATRKTEWLATAAAATALIWAVLGVLWAQVILLPEPLLPPPSFAELLGRVPATTRPDRFIIMLFKETSLLLTAYALLGMLMCTLAGRAGARKSSLLATLLCVTIAVASLVPVAQATKIAYAKGVPLSLARYFADLSPVPDRFANRSPETVPYAHSGGEVLKVDVWEPPGEDGRGSGQRSGLDVAAQRRPAVIVVHGGGWRSGERSDFPSWDAWLADEGYVVFDIDYRLSPPPSWRDAPSDVACAVGWVKENAARYGVDPERVALMGRSAGGHLALLTAYEEGRAAATPGCVARDVRDTGVAAVVAFYPPTDLARLSSMGYLGGMDRFLGGSRSTVPGRYRHLSPVSHVDPADPPTFLAYGGADRIIPPGQSQLLGERLLEAGVPHRLVELPWANHTFDFLWDGWGSQITRYSLEVFLESNLKTQAEKAKTPGSFEHQFNGQRHEGGHSEKDANFLELPQGEVRRTPLLQAPEM
jgi:acetyl esterase/lipase